MPTASYYDLESFRGKYADESKFPTMKFYIEGVKCGRCVEKIEKLENSNPQINSLRVSLPTQQLTIELKSKSDSFSSIINEIESLGFKLHAIKKQSDATKLSAKEDRQELIRLAVAAMSASNIMMFSIAIYAGSSPEFTGYFQWLCFLLYLPFLLYVAIPIYKGCYYSIKELKLSVDLPLTVASIGGFIFSTINLLRGQGSIYFDSLSGFLFLILISRFVQKKLQRHFLSFRGKGYNDSFERARKFNGVNFEWEPVENLKVNDQILIKSGEIIPADGFLLSSDARIDSSMLTGESEVLIKYQGNQLQAGVVLLSPEATLKVVRTGGDTHFGQLLTQVRDNGSLKSPVQNLSDRMSQILIITVFTAAILFILVNWSTSPEMALERALALVILACPCAMAFGTPLALSFSLKKAFRKGFLIRSADVFEKLLNVENVFLDKTGTLSSKKLKVESVQPARISNEVISIILGLEKQSSHPIAEALKAHFANKNILPAEILNPQEVVGKGVYGRYNGRKYSIESFESIFGKKSVGLFSDEAVLAVIYLEDALLESSKNLIRKIENKLNVFILSGDSKAQVQKVAVELNIKDQKCFAEMTPQMKAEKVSEYRNTLMVGDGVNDSLAFKKADVGISVQGAVESALKSSDVYLMSGDVSKLDDLFLIALASQKLIRRNLIISVIYNVLGGTAALLGFVNPLVAAVLMPISSGFILLSTYLGSRK